MSFKFELDEKVQLKAFEGAEPKEVQVVARVEHSQTYYPNQPDCYLVAYESTPENPSTAWWNEHQLNKIEHS